jgi:uncharacterized protein involved in exopolysaccharide biosynthesis
MSGSSAPDLEPAHLLRSVRRHRKVLVLVLAAAILAGVVHFLVAPRTWTVEVSILPSLQESWDLPAGLGDALDLGMLPLRGGGTDPTLLAPEVLVSDRLLRPLLEERHEAYGGRSLAALLGENAAPAEDAARRLRSCIDIDRSRRTGIVAVRVGLPRPAAAEHLAQRLLEELDAYWRISSTGRAAELRAFLDARLGEVARDLHAAEESLTAFRSANRSLGDSPSLRQEEARLQREVLLQETLYVELHRQGDMARVQELKDLPVLRILDRPRLPERFTSPRLATSLVGAALIGLVLGLAYALGRDLIVPAWRRWLREA